MVTAKKLLIKTLYAFGVWKSVFILLVKYHFSHTYNVYGIIFTSYRYM